MDRLSAISAERDFQYKHLLDLAKAASAHGEARCSRFLNPAQFALAHKAAKEARVSVRLWGGYEDAEYRMARFSGDGDEARWPITCLRAEWNPRYGQAEHRDLLGAVMGRGITRDSLGDIVMAEHSAFLFLTEEAGRYIATNLLEAGRVKLKLSPAEGDLAMPPPKGRLIRETIPSMRLDALIAAVLSLSRERAKQLVERGEVRLNHLETDQAGAKAGEGDLVSVRGYGRFKIQEIQGETKKGRIGVVFFKYGS